MFFLMLLTLGLDSSFGGSEAIITALSDEYELIRKNREIFVACLFSFYFIVGLTTCTEGGVYIFQLLDSYAAGYSILVTVLFEAIAISWIYGIKRFKEDLKEMLGFEIGRWWTFCWLVLSPFFLLTIIIYGIINYQPISYQDYVYPRWANVLGWCIAFSSMCAIPVLACHQMMKAKGTFMQRLKFCITPKSSLVNADRKNVRLSSITYGNNRTTDNTVYV